MGHGVDPRKGCNRTTIAPSVPEEMLRRKNEREEGWKGEESSRKNGVYYPE